jgi:hypothetical protein
MYFRATYNQKFKAIKYSEVNDATERRRIDDEELQDLTPHITCSVPGQDIVAVAKPSPKPSSTSFGSPSSVPNVGGLLFPYFPGMLRGDTVALRDLCGRLMFRNFSGSDARSAWKEVRGILGTFANTESGVKTQHILLGASLALDTQTQLYLLFDRGEYMGFCLLGVEFDIMASGRWHPALSAEELRKELNTMVTHEGALENLCAKLKRMKMIDGEDMMFEEDETSTQAGLAMVLSRVDDRKEDDARELSDLLAKLQFPTSFKTFSPDNIAWAVKELTTNIDTPFDTSIPIWLPLEKWRSIGSKEFLVFASFGSRSFSFRNSKGTEINVPKDSEPDAFAVRGEDGKLKWDKLVVVEKATRECVVDWATLKSKRSIRMDYKERALGSRNHVFRDKNIETIWSSLKVAANADLLGSGEDASNLAVKRTAAVAFGEGSFEDF